MTKQEQLEMDRDTILDYVETINAMLYEETIQIEMLERQIKEYGLQGE